jgi:serine/threonine-protein kinase
LTEEPDRPRKLNPDIPEGLELVVQKAMAKEPADRYAEMDELDAALAPFDVGTGVVPPPPSSSSPILPTAKTSHPSLPGASGKVDTTARTMMAQSMAVADAKMSRPTIVISTLGLVLWLIAGMVDALGGALRYWRHDTDITAEVGTLLLVFAPLVVLSPAVYFILHVRKNKWNNSVRALELAGDLRRTFFAVALTYAFLMLGIRVAWTVLLRRSDTLSSGSWDVLAFAASSVIGVLTWSSASLARSVRKRRNK